jgi:hypothetical protein
MRRLAPPHRRFVFGAGLHDEAWRSDRRPTLLFPPYDCPFQAWAVRPIDLVRQVVTVERRRWSSAADRFQRRTG